MRGLAGGEFLQQWQQRSDDLVEIGPVIPYGRTQSVQHRIKYPFRRQVLFDGHHAFFSSHHMSRRVLLVELALDLDDDLPRFRISLGEKLLGVLDEQRVNVDHMPLNLQVVRAPTQFDQGAGNDVDEAPGKLAEGG
ncbi:hypothetical protein D3C73_1122500 [compost metagenome]